jgi:hypothetical protein
MADQLSRRKVMCTAAAASCLAAWLLAVIPSIEVYVVAKLLNLIGDVGGSIRNALLRDLFSGVAWESANGGITGIKSRIAVLVVICSGVAVAVGMGTLRFGDGLLGLPNEYSERKEDCKGQTHCVPRGSFTWHGDGWRIDGSLRLLMIMGASTFTLEALLLCLFLPETLPPECRKDVGVVAFVRQHYWETFPPWNNLRVFATEQLKALMESA